MDLADALTIAGAAVTTAAVAFLFGVGIAALVLGCCMTGAGLYFAIIGARK